MTGWISVADGLPEYERRVLAFGFRYSGLPYELMIVYRCSTNASGEHWIIDQGSCGNGVSIQDQMSYDSDKALPEVSHWMPLPDEPR